jgi:hypothetical protein
MWRRPNFRNGKEQEARRKDDMKREPDVTFRSLPLFCPSCGKSNWMVTRAGTRLLCQDCFHEFKLVEVEKT